MLRLPAGSDRLETFPEAADGRRFHIANALACDAVGNLYVACYEPSATLRVDRLPLPPPSKGA